MIAAVIQTFDFVHVHQIDVTAFFEQASDSDIKDLLRCETDHYARVWHGRKKAYGGHGIDVLVKVYDFMLNKSVLKLVERYHKDTAIGCSLYVLASDLENWLKENRPHLLV